MLTSDAEGGLYPSQLSDTIADFDKVIVWKKTGGGGKDDEIPEPQEGLCEEFDQANKRIDVIKAKLNDLLNQIRAQFKD